MRFTIFICFFLSLSTLVAQEVVLRDFYENGNVLREWGRVGKSDTVVENIYHPNGKLTGRYQLRDGERNGEAFVYMKDGTLLFQENYVNGQLNGVFKCFYPGGQVQRVEHYNNGAKVDTSEYFYNTGILEKKEIYQQPCYRMSGTCNFLVEVYHNNVKAYTYKVINGLKSSQYEVFDEEGYQKLMDLNKSVSLSEKGKIIFTSNCGMCHRLDKAIVGPALQCVTRKYSSEEIFKMVTDSEKHQTMPLSEEDFDLLINYIDENCQ